MLLIGFYQAENIEFETLFTNIPLADCKGHCCDGASSMAGAKTNLATRINGDTIKGIKLMNGTLDTAFELNKLAIKKIFKNCSIIDVCQGSEYASEYIQSIFEKNQQISFVWYMH